MEDKTPDFLSEMKSADPCAWACFVLEAARRRLAHSTYSPDWLKNRPERRAELVSALDILLDRAQGKLRVHISAGDQGLQMRCDPERDKDFLLNTIYRFIGPDTEEVFIRVGRIARRRREDKKGA